MENKTGKYFKYAIGEIVLVVLGILIALGINNQNQERIKQERVDKILMKIQTDISQDIGYSDWLISTYIERNDIKDKVLDNQFDYNNLTPSDLDDLGKMTFSWGNLPSQMGGYNQLTDNLEDVPDDYQELVRKLNFTYRSPKEWVDLYTKHTQKLALGYKVFLTNNHPWYSEDSFNNEISSAQIKYYQNNPKFKNRVMESMDARKGLMWAHASFRARITENYVLINDLLGDKVKSQPNKIRKTSLMAEHDAQKYIGTYDEEIKTPNGQSIEITAEDKDLYITDASGKRRLLYFHDEKPWFGYQSNIIMFDGQENTTLRLITGRQKTAVYRRRISQ